MRRWKVRFRGHPAAGLLIATAMSWFVLEGVTTCNYVGDSHGAYEGTVVEVRGKAWYDELTMLWITPEHLIVETPDGQVIDRYVAMSHRMQCRIEPGDYVVKERGFGNRVTVPGKKTVSEIIEDAGR